MGISVQKRLMASIAVGALMVPLAPVYAQGADSADEDDNVIVVTAKGREQVLQEVPLSIAVFSEEELEVRGVSDVQDLADITPNLEISSPSGRRDAVFAVRGLGSSTTDEKYQSVGFFVDGIWMGGQIVGLSTSDVERIEVIKGPHSTFGRATYGASIDYVTKTPSLDEFGGNVTAQVSRNKTGVDANYEITGSVSGPIIPGSLSFSLFGQTRNDAGINPAFSNGLQLSEVGKEETNLISGVIYAKLGDSTSLKIRGLYTEDNDTFINGFESRPQYWLQQGADVVQNTAGQAWIRGAVPDPIREEYYSSDVTATHLAGTEPGTLDREKFFVSAILEHEFDSGMTIRYSGSYMEQEEDALFDGIAPPGNQGGIDAVLGNVAPLNITLGGFNNVIREEWTEMSHTLRILSSDEGPFIWSFGGFYYDSDNTNFTPNPAFINLFRSTGRTVDDFGKNRTEDIDQWALFGAVEYEFSDQFSFALEGRYQEETVKRLATPDALFSSQRLPTTLSRTEKKFDPRITLTYSPNENHNLYALFAQGHKSGRFNFGGSGALAGSAPEDLQDPALWLYVEPERLQSYEIGWKGNTPAGDIRWNIAAFYQDVTDQQFLNSTINPNGPGTINQLQNVGNSEIYGFEADLTWQATDNLTFQGAIGYNDQEFKNDVIAQESNNLYIFQLAGDAAGSETLQGRSFSNVSKFSANFSTTYTVPVDLGGMFDEWSTRLDVLYKGKKYVDNANLAYIPGNARLNLRTNFTGENWELSMFVMNLLDDKSAYRGNAFPCGLSSVTDSAAAATLGLAGPTPVNLAGGQRCLSLLPSPSREVGVSMKFKF